MWPNYIEGLGQRRLGGLALCTSKYCEHERGETRKTVAAAYADKEHPINHPDVPQQWWRAYCDMLGLISLTGTWMRYGDIALCVRCARQMAKNGDDVEKEL